MNERERLIQAIDTLDAQRDVLGDQIVDDSIAVLRDKLGEIRKLPGDERRKQVTVLFADLAGFTAMSEDMDPEEVREVQQAYFDAVTLPIKQHWGVIEKFIGDAILAVFGIPQAREKDPENAVRAALRMHQALEDLNVTIKKTHGVQLQMRIGINTGLVVAAMGEDERDFVVTGDTVNLASRLESAAPPGEVLISEETFRHVEGKFEVGNLDPIAVKGKADPVPVYQVYSVKPYALPSNPRGVEGVVTRMIGREEEFKRLQQSLRSAGEDRRCAMITIVAEAGLGKSRLIYEFERWVRATYEDVAIYKGRANQLTQNRPYALLRNLLSTTFQIQENDASDVVRRKFEAGFMDVFHSVRDGNRPAHVVGQFLGFDFGDSPLLGELGGNPKHIKEAGMDFLVEFFQETAKRAPVVISLENIHWADDSSLDGIYELSNLISDRQLLILATTRPEFIDRRAEWLNGADFRSGLILEPLSKEESRQLVFEIMRKATNLPKEFLELVVRKSDGNPLFVEELIKMLVEERVVTKKNGNWDIEPSRLKTMQVPATLTGILQARVDRLSPEERLVLQRAAVVGRRFWASPILQKMEPEESQLLSGDVRLVLSSLESKELVFLCETSTFDGTEEYIFKHALLRDVAYESILKRKRRTYHQKVADWIVVQSEDRVGEYLGLIGEHLRLAERPDRAMNYFHQAGERAIKLSASKEAMDSLWKAIDLVKILPYSPDLAQRELILHIRLGAAVMAAKGPGSKDVEEIYERAYEICRQIGQTPDLIPILFGLWRFYLLRSKLEKAYQLAQELYELALQFHGPDSPFMLEASLALGATQFWLGEFSHAREHFERVVSQHDPDKYSKHVFLHGQDPVMVLLPYLAFTLWFLGYPDRSMETVQKAVDLAEEIQHPFSQAYSLFGASKVYSLCRNPSKVGEFAAATIELSTDREFPYFLAIGTILQGWALAESGQQARGIIQIRQGLGLLRDTGGEAARTYYLALLAEACCGEGKFVEGLSVIREALNITHAGGERHYQAELTRLQGELLWSAAQSGQEIPPQWIDLSADDCFRKAIAIARGQGSKMLELRAVMSWSRLLHHHGKSELAREELSAIYDWFSEGYGTDDLTRAKRLLETMSNT